MVGVVVLIAVSATVFASLAFSHLHVSMKLDVCPPPGAQVPGLGWVSAALFGAGSLLMGWRSGGSSLRDKGLLQLAVLLAMACATGAWALDFAAHMQAGLAPSHHAWGATVAALLGWQGLHAFVLLLMGGYVVARWPGRCVPDARATLDNTALMWHYTTVQGLAGMALVRMLPQWMGG